MLAPWSCFFLSMTSTWSGDWHVECSCLATTPTLRWWRQWSLVDLDRTRRWSLVYLDHARTNFPTGLGFARLHTRPGELRAEQFTRNGTLRLYPLRSCYPLRAPRPPCGERVRFVRVCVKSISFVGCLFCSFVYVHAHVRVNTCAFSASLWRRAETSGCGEYDPRWSKGERLRRIRPPDGVRAQIARACPVLDG